MPILVSLLTSAQEDPLSYAKNVLTAKLHVNLFILLIFTRGGREKVGTWNPQQVGFSFTKETQKRLLLP